MKRTPLLCTFALSCAVANGLPAQTITYEPQSEGPLVGLPHGMSVAPGTESPAGPVDDTELKVKADGYSLLTPGDGSPVFAGQPDYRMSAILQGVDPRPGIDAFSVGLDWVLTDGDGVAIVPPGNWTAMSFSVTPSTLGDTGSVIRGENARPDGAAGDLFSYVYEGSTLPAPLVDVVLRAQDSSEIALGSAAAPRPDIDAHDLFVELVWRLNPQIVPLLPPILQTPRAFFSVTPSSLGLVPTPWWAGTAPSAATVLCSEWTGTLWTEPRPLVTFAELGLGVEENVDALAVDFFRNEMLFSTDTPGDPPVLWATGFGHTVPGAGPTPGIGPALVIVRVFRTILEVALPKSVGPLVTDDVDAICTLDPGGDPVIGRLLGTPDFLALPATNTELSVAVYRRFDPVSSSESFVSYGSGWPFPGRGPGLIAGFAAPINPVNFIAIQPVVPGPVRNPLSLFGGDPHSIELPIPQFVSGLGVPVYFYWLSADQGFQSFGQSWPVRIVL